MDFHEFILFFVFLPLADSGRGLAERAVAPSWHLPVGSFRWGDKIGGAEVALGMPLPDGLQQES